MLSDYCARGVWGDNRKARFKYLGNRPNHVILRVENEKVVEPVKYRDYHQAEQDFYCDLSEDILRLVVRNHDPIWDKPKHRQYAQTYFVA